MPQPSLKQSHFWWLSDVVKLVYPLWIHLQGRGRLLIHSFMQGNRYPKPVVSLYMTKPNSTVYSVLFVSYNFKTFDKMFSRDCTVLKAHFSLSVHSLSSLSSVWSSSQDDPSGWIQKPRHRAELKVSRPQTVVGCFLRVPVHCYAYDWSLWVHLTGEAPTNQPLCDHKLLNP